MAEAPPEEADTFAPQPCCQTTGHHAFCQRYDGFAPEAKSRKRRLEAVEEDRAILARLAFDEQRSLDG